MSELDHVGAIRSSIVRALTCDTSVMRVVLAGASRPLDVGRRTAVVPPGIRRAVILRDRTYRFPACDRPHSWCDAHHVVHWAEGGSTSLDNLVLLCRRHHRLVHSTFSLRMVAGEPEFRRADGTLLPDTRPPPRLIA